MFGRKRGDGDVYYGVTRRDPKKDRFPEHKRATNRRGEPTRAREIIEKYDLDPEDVKILKTDMIGEEAAVEEQKRSSEPSRRGIDPNKDGYSLYEIGPNPEPSLTKRFLKRIFGIGKDGDDVYYG